MRFDWYQATIEDRPQNVLRVLSKLGNEVRSDDSLARMYHYGQGWAVHGPDCIVARVFAGGNGAYPHALASSNSTDAFVDLVRSRWPDRHIVTRMDAAQDFNESGAYDRIRPVARAVALRHRLSFPAYQDELDPFAGRTQYIGSPKSDYRARLYEKGWEQVAKMVGSKQAAGHVTLIRNEATGEDLRPENWVRLELQVRPREADGRRAAATSSPEQAWAFTPWAKELAAKAMELDLARVIVRHKTVSVDEHVAAWMCRHYSKSLSRAKSKYQALERDGMVALLSDLDDDQLAWACVGLEIGERCDAMNRIKRRT